MSAYSDWKVGALSDREFRDECNRMDRQDRIDQISILTDYEPNDYEEVIEQSLSTMDKYLDDYASHQPMRDGEEMRLFFEEMKNSKMEDPNE